MTAVIQTAKKKYYREVVTVTLVLAFLLTMWAINTANGAALTGERDTLSNSRPDITSNHTIRYVVNNAFAANNGLTLNLSTGFDLSGITEPGDFDFSFGPDDSTQEDMPLTAGGTSSADTWAVQRSGQEVIFTAASDAASLPGNGDVVLIEVGTNATFGFAGANQVTNPSKLAGDDPGTASVYSLEFDFEDGTDTGTALMAIIEGVNVSATVAETLSASIASVTSGNCDTSFNADNPADTVNATTIAFGTLQADQHHHGCHDIAIGTNAANGYSATAQENTALFESSADNTIPNFTADSASPTQAGAWGTETGFGYSCDTEFGVDGTAGCSSDFNGASTNSYRPFADRSLGQSPAEFASATEATTNTMRVDYRVRITNDQPAGDYTNIVTYVLTPAF